MWTTEIRAPNIERMGSNTNYLETPRIMTLLRVNLHIHKFSTTSLDTT